jgi:polyhydroxyalkanoate synthesis repressor PhaR
MKVIKKYSNRRMYDTEESKVVTLEDIAEYVKEDIDLKVIDNNTNEDITTNVLLQTLLKIDQALDKEDKIKNTILKNIIKDYIEKPFSVLKRITFAGMGIADLTRKDLEKFFAYLIKQGKESQQYGAEFMRNSLDKASADLKKEVKNFADNLYQSMVSLNLFGIKETNKKPNDKVTQDDRDNPSTINERSNNDEDKDRRIHELEEEIRQLKEELNQKKSVDDET